MKNKVIITIFLGIIISSFSSCSNTEERVITYSETDVLSNRDSLLSSEFDGKEVTISALDEYGEVMGNGAVNLFKRDFNTIKGPKEEDGRKPSRGKVYHKKKYEILAARYFDGDLRFLLKSETDMSGWVSATFTKEYRNRSETN